MQPAAAGQHSKNWAAGECMHVTEVQGVTPAKLAQLLGIDYCHSTPRQSRQGRGFCFHAMYTACAFHDVSPYRASQSCLCEPAEGSFEPVQCVKPASHSPALLLTQGTAMPPLPTAPTAAASVITYTQPRKPTWTTQHHHAEVTASAEPQHLYTLEPFTTATVYATQLTSPLHQPQQGACR